MNLDLSILFKIGIAILGLLGCVYIVNGIKRGARRLKYKLNNLLSPLNSVVTMAKMVEEMDKLQDEAPEIKTVGGMTDIYLKQILRDYPDYHNNDAEDAIKQFIREYLYIKYGMASDYDKARVGERTDIYIDKQPKATLSDIRINAIAIYNYQKSRDYATVTYRVSVGYNISDSKRIETRYEVDYTIQLRDNQVASEVLKCENCGGIYNSLTDTNCPYCGVGIVRDTIMSWYITDSKEI